MRDRLKRPSVTDTLGRRAFSANKVERFTHHCLQAMTPEEVLREGPALEDEATEASVFGCAIADVEGSKVSVGVVRGGWGTGALVVGGWDKWKCEELIWEEDEGTSTEATDLLRAEFMSKGKQCGMASSYAEDVNDWECDWTEAL